MRPLIGFIEGSRDFVRFTRDGGGWEKRWVGKRNGWEHGKEGLGAGRENWEKFWGYLEVEWMGWSGYCLVMKGGDMKLEGLWRKM
jgi:hypothetical protein